mmetsp:Transcript_1222/g.1955  ORF Transcript_1222/g.1955 Transcript_1222/m.1955 type:complete len:190 (+) Transcript_1222:44-613(+)
MNRSISIAARRCGMHSQRVNAARPSSLMHSLVRRVGDEEEENRLAGTRGIHMTRRMDNMTPLVVGGGIAVIAYSGKLIVEAIDRRAQAQEAAAKAAENGEEETKEQEAGGSWFSNLGFSFGKRFYEGGFEEEMTRREASQILGIRESAPREKVREAHRRLALLNHPDTGGSTYVSSKINEAKDKLLNTN